MRTRGFCNCHAGFWSEDHKPWCHQAIKKRIGNIAFAGWGIERLQLSTRSYNCLNSWDIDLVSQLVVLTEDDLKHIKNMGKRAIADIKDALGRNGLSLGMDITSNVCPVCGRGEYASEAKREIEALDLLVGRLQRTIESLREDLREPANCPNSVPPSKEDSQDADK